MNLSKTELELVVDLLDAAADQFSNNGCNDYELPESMSKTEIKALAEALHADDDLGPQIGDDA